MRTLMLLVLVLGLSTPANAQWGYPVQTIHDHGYTYELYSSGNIVRVDTWGRRELIDNGTGTTMIAAGDRRLYVLKNNGNIWMFRSEQWRQIDNGTGTSRIWVEWSRVYCRKNNGQVWYCVDPYRMQWNRVRDGIEALRTTLFNQLHGE